MTDLKDLDEAWSRWREASKNLEVARETEREHAGAAFHSKVALSLAIKLATEAWAEVLRIRKELEL